MAITYTGKVVKMEAGDTLSGVKRVREIRATTADNGTPAIIVHVGGASGPVLGREQSPDLSTDETIIIADYGGAGVDLKNLHLATATAVADFLVTLG